jgi:hypothetical protein
VPARSILHLLAPNRDIAKFVLCSNNTPVVITTRPEAYAFDVSLGEWTVIVRDPSHAPSSRGDIASDGPLAEIEREVTAQVSTTNGAADNGSDLSDDGIVADQSARIQTRMCAAKLLGSRAEYRIHVEEFARALRNVGQATELVRDLASAARDTHE